MKVILAVLIGLLIGGCYSAGERQRELAAAAKLNWKAAHPGEVITPEVEAQIEAEAIKAQQAERAEEKKKAMGDLGAAAGRAVTGDYVGAGLLALGSLLCLLGFKKGHPSTEAGKAPPSGGAA